MSESNGQVCGFIHDGYTRTAFIKAVDWLYPPTRIKFRPLLTQERAVVQSRVNRVNNPRQSEQHAAEAIFRQLVEWDLKDSGGAVVSIKLENILRVQPELMQRMYLIVMAIEGGDDDPQGASGEEENANDLEDELAGKPTVGPEAASAKNSGAASG